MKKYHFLALLMTAVLSFVFTSCKQENDSAAFPEGAAAARGAKQVKLVMATNAEFPPYESIAEDGSYQGIDIDIMQAICEATGRQLIVENIAFDSIIPAVVSGKADCGVAGMTVTEDRLRNVDFTTPYFTAYQVIVVAKDSPIQGKDDLVGKRIGVQTGTTGDAMAGEIDGVQMNRYSKGAEAILALVQNKIDAVVIDNAPARAFVAKNADKLLILDTPLSDESYAMAVKKGNAELLAMLNEQIARIKADGTLEAILAKYKKELEGTDE